MYFNDGCPPDAPPQALENTRACLERIASQADPGGGTIYFAIHIRAEDDFIGAEIYGFNLRLIRLFEKLGCRRESTLRQTVFKDGRFHDELLSGLLRHEWIDCCRPTLL